MANHQADVLDQHRRDAELSHSELWIRYFGLGGMSSARSSCRRSSTALCDRATTTMTSSPTRSTSGSSNLGEIIPCPTRTTRAVRDVLELIEEPTGGSPPGAETLVTAATARQAFSALSSDPCALRDERPG